MFKVVSNCGNICFNITAHNFRLLNFKPPKPFTFQGCKYRKLTFTANQFLKY